MRLLIPVLTSMVIGATLVGGHVSPAAAQAPGAAAAKAPKDPRRSDSPLFRSESVLPVTFTVNLKTLKKDKADKAPWRAATLTYADSAAPEGKKVVPVRARTRGMWRLKNCDFPPVRLNFANKEVKGTVWNDLDEPKLVSYCRNNDTYEQFVLQELQLYRVYRLLTPVSHHVRLLRMSYADSATGKVEVTRYAFIVEDPAIMAKRVGGKVMDAKGATPDDLEPHAATVAYMFQYLIGNTDFSFSGLHNAELMAMPTGLNYPIAYDFDFAGAISAPYAAPDVSLPIKRVRDRLYRGFCQQNSVVPEVIRLFQEKKSEIYALYADEVGALMNPGKVKETLAYFDEFYATIGSPKETEKRILRECREMK